MFSLKGRERHRKSKVFSFLIIVTLASVRSQPELNALTVIKPGAIISPNKIE